MELMICWWIPCFAIGQNEEPDQWQDGGDNPA
jgi:hypothetical protein